MKSNKKVPVNTLEEFRQNLDLFGLGAMVMGADAILVQEAQGQRSLVNSDTLPTKMSLEDKKVLEAAGVKFGEKVPGDEMFQYAELPAGWKKERTDHSMWSNLVDDKGRVRAAIFYKAAFYDRSAHMGLTRRFNTRFDYTRRDGQGDCVSHVTDSGKVVHTTEPYPYAGLKSYEASDRANGLAAEWLNANYPNWDDSSAYWD